MPIPDLPDLPTEDSLLSRKFGREVANYFSGSPLNRVSFLRGDRDFLRSAFAHPRARFLLLRDLAPLVRADDPARLAFARRADVAPLLVVDDADDGGDGSAPEQPDPDPFGKTEDEMIRDFDSDRARRQVVIVFLGVDEGGVLAAERKAEEEEEEEGEPFRYKDFEGDPYFAVDVTPREGVEDKVAALAERLKGRGWVFYDGGPRHMGLHAGQGEGIFSFRSSMFVRSRRKRSGVNDAGLGLD